jgi:acetyl esterase/lipase
MNPYVITTHTYKIIDRCDLCLDVYTRPDGAPRPGIIWLHGGGLILGSRRMLPTEQARRYVEAGFTVIAADYRLAPETKVSAILEDIENTYHWVRDQGERIGVDTSRIALIGHSAGGYLALSCASRFIPRPKAVVSFYGYGDISGEWAFKPSPFYCEQVLVSKEEAYQNIGRKITSHSSVHERLGFYLYCRQQGIWGREIVGKDIDDFELLVRLYCPIHTISSDYPPTLLLHGDQDTDVPVSESLSLAEKFSGAATKYELIILPGYGHGFDMVEEGSGDPHVSQAFEAVIKFLKKFV